MNYTAKSQLLRSAFASSFSKNLCEKLEEYGVESTENFIVLDIECGNGYSTLSLAKHLPKCSRIIGIDMQPSLIQEAIENRKLAGISPTEVEFYQLNIQNISTIPDVLFIEIGISPRSVHLITFQHTFPMQYREHMLQTMQKLLIPNGFIMILNHLWSSFDPTNHEYLKKLKKGASKQLLKFVPESKPTDDTVTECWKEIVDNVAFMTLCTVGELMTSIQIKNMKEIIFWSENLCPLLKFVPGKKRVKLASRYLNMVMDKHFIPEENFSIEINAIFVLLQSTLQTQIPDYDNDFGQFSHQQINSHESIFY